MRTFCPAVLCGGIQVYVIFVAKRGDISVLES